MKYKITFYTGTKSGAGTDANISIKISGEKYSTEKIDLSKFFGKSDFEKGSVSHCTIDLPDLGMVKSFSVYQNGKGFGSDWFLSHITVENIDRNKFWFVNVNKWIEEGKGYNFRTVSAKEYLIEIFTGTLPGSGTDSNIFFSFKGTKAKTGFININAFTEDDSFKSGHITKFRIVLPVFGTMKSLNVTSDDEGISSNWYLNRVVLYDSGNLKKTAFSFFNWVKPFETYSLLPDLSEYTIKVYTGNIAGAGTDANVKLVIEGTKGKTPPIRLNELVAKNVFEAGNLDIFKIVSKNLGELRKITVSHDEQWLADGWYLNKIVIENPQQKKHWEFPCYTWLDKSEAPHKTKLELTTAKPEPRPFYVIAHMVNTPSYVEEALDMGANAIECDITPRLQPDGSFKFEVYHGFRPDFDPDSINLMERSVAKTGLPDFLDYLNILISEYKNFSLIIFDNKLGKVPKSKLEQCGVEFVNTISKQIPFSVNGIKCVLSVPGSEYVDFIRGAHKAIKKKNLRFIGFDFSEENIYDSMMTFRKLKFPNLWWGRGIASTVPKPVTHFIPQFLLAAKFRRRRGIIKKIYYWTLDDPDSMARMMVTALDGIIVNDPVKLLKVLEKEEFKHKYRLATRKDDPFSIFK